MNRFVVNILVMMVLGGLIGAALYINKPNTFGTGTFIVDGKVKQAPMKLNAKDFEKYLGLSLAGKVRTQPIPQSEMNRVISLGVGFLRAAEQNVGSNSERSQKMCDVVREMMLRGWTVTVQEDSLFFDVVEYDILDAIGTEGVVMDEINARMFLVIWELMDAFNPDDINYLLDHELIFVDGKYEWYFAGIKVAERR